jgi:lipoprotein signal peptidase
MRDLTRSQFDILFALVTTGSVVFTDRITKIFFSDFLAYGESLPVIRNVLHMTLVHNTGIAFGFFRMAKTI